MHSPWLSWLYHYGVGGGIFFVGLRLAFRTRAARRSLWTDRRMTLQLIADVSMAAGVRYGFG